jgi:hypothetical protein
METIAPGAGVMDLKNEQGEGREYGLMNRRD